eukprot:CAMPEP_0198112428 /NCGR_PEP_ID=MMETSP1442-20131203/4276_1 /TAXON_ID= /ORGANISM="Craspedostauros australis, Strain CCMP3328" /LENGTH=49 /DNA_ID=CAMNT_0043769191 /DNA_START=1181 /DNA_END=1330 /DNA_ORIENTATION=+
MEQKVVRFVAALATQETWDAEKETMTEDGPNDTLQGAECAKDAGNAGRQ